jgi:hypothetical protein
MRQIILLAASAFAAGCGPAASPEAGLPANAAGALPYAFEVQLTLTARTLEKLAGMRERVTVSAMYWGEANDAAKSRIDAIAQINLGADAISVEPASQLVAISGAALDPTMLGSDVSGAPQVLVNVYTARRAHPDNLISCGVYEGPISMAQEKPVDIKCDLIEAMSDAPRVGAPVPN